jgi:hypothetical protein
LKGEKGKMRKCNFILFFFIIFILVFFIVNGFKTKDVIQECIIKEIIPYEISQGFDVPYKRILIIESKKMGKEWNCYFIALTSEQSNELFVVAVFNPPEKEEDQVELLIVTEGVADAYLLEILGLKQAEVEGVEILRSRKFGFLVLRLKKAQFDGKPLRDYL